MREDPFSLDKDSQAPQFFWGANQVWFDPFGCRVWVLNSLLREVKEELQKLVGGLGHDQTCGNGVLPSTEMGWMDGKRKRNRFLSTSRQERQEKASSLDQQLVHKDAQLCF